MQRIDLRAALAVVLKAHPHRQGEEIGEALLEPLVTGDFAADIADHPAEPDAQELEFAPRPFELVGMAIPADHDRGALGHTAIALPQWHAMALGEIHQLVERAMAEPCVGRVSDRLRLHSGVNYHSFEILRRQCCISSDLT
jgi:hypothetical protein